MIKENEIIRFDDRLVYHGSYNLSARAVKTICYVIAKYVDPKSDGLPDVVRVPIADLCNALSDGRKGKSTKSLYYEIDRLCQELTTSPIKFKSDVEVDGLELDGYATWCSTVVPKTHNGVKCIEFYFCKYLGQFLLGLSQYVRLYRPELNRLTTGYAIRLFQILKGERNKKEKFGINSTYVFELSRLRFLLGLGEKYKGYKDFNKYILRPSVEQINDRTTISVHNVKEIRKQGGRTVTHVEFHFMNQSPQDSLGYLAGGKSLSDFVPGEAEEQKLTRSQTQAYESLVEFGVKPGIAYRRIVQQINGSESHGFEDFFIRFALEYFGDKSKNKKSRDHSAATFVTWWTGNRIFDVNSDVWSKINEKVVGVRKKMEHSEPEKYANRLAARTMTNAEFEAWYRRESGLKTGTD